MAQVSESWQKLLDIDMGATITIRQICEATGLGRRTVRDMIRRYKVDPLPPTGGRNQNRYITWSIKDAVQKMPGKGRHAASRERSPKHGDLP